MSALREARTLGLIASLGLTAAGAVAAAQPSLAVGEPAPPLELVATDGTIRNLAEADRPVVLVYFRGLW